MKVINFFKVYGSLILIAISAVLIPFGINLSTKVKLDLLSLGPILTLFGLVLFIAGSITNYRRTKNYEENKNKLNEKNTELETISSQNKKMYGDIFSNLYEILQIYLANIVANELNDIITTKERITIYAHDKTIDSFRQIGRYSPHPKFTRRSSSRKYYPEDQGSIGVAWKNGECEITLFDPAKEFEKYKDQLIEDYNFKEETVHKITMPSRLFIGYAIENNKKNKVGVILFESTQLNRLKKNKNKLNEIAADKHNVIQTILEKENALRNMLPSYN